MNNTTNARETVYPLATQLITTFRRGSRSTQPGYLVFKKPSGEFAPGGCCFRTNGGTWYLATLFGLDSQSRRSPGPIDRLAIDFGQDWYAENIGDVLREIVGSEPVLAIEVMCDAIRKLGGAACPS